MHYSTRNSTATASACPSASLLTPTTPLRTLQSSLREVRDDGDAVHELLRNEAHRSEHGEAAVLQLLGLHLSERLWCVRLEAKRVEFDVTRVVVVVQEVRAITLGRRHLRQSETKCEGERLRA